MSGSSAIEWTDATWNPVVGCEAVSPGCDHCYAAREASGRLKHLPVYAGLADRGVFNGTVRLLPERLDDPLRWRRPRRIFVNSMSDLFHPDVPDEFIGEVFARMDLAKWHTFQVLTKRPQRLAAWLDRGGKVTGPFGEWTVGTPEYWRARERRAVLPDVQRLADRSVIDLAVRWPLPNVWIGTSIEAQRYAWRADHLRDAPAAVRFLSCEPLLGPLSLDLTGIGWVIVGGESGPRARPMHPEWARSIRDQCVAAGVPFLFKQAGAVLGKEWGCKSAAGHDIESFPAEFQIREYPDGG